MASTGLACLSAGELKAEHYTRRPLFGMSGHHATKHLPGSHGISAHHRVGCSGTTTRCLKLELSRSRAGKAGWLTGNCLHTCPTQLLVSILGQMRWFCSCRWVLLWEPRTTDSLHKAHHALKHMPVLIFRWLGKASRQKRYIIYSALRSRQSRGSTA